MPHAASEQPENVPQSVNLVNMTRRQLVWVLPAVMVAADAAKAEEVPINTEEECRECNGLGVTPCEQRDGL
jgi:hypothetical protein